MGLENCDTVVVIYKFIAICNISARERSILFLNDLKHKINSILFASVNTPNREKENFDYKLNFHSSMSNAYCDVQVFFEGLTFDLHCSWTSFC